MRLRRTFLPWVGWYAIVLHAIAGPTLLFSSSAGLATGPDGVVRFFGSHELAGLVIIASTLIAAVVLLRGSGDVLWLLPQQFLLSLAAINAIVAVLAGQYADGVARPFAFILTDQLPVILMAVFHLAMLAELFRKHEVEALEPV